MDTEELERAVQHLRDDLEDERRQRAKLLADFTQLSAKLRNPGTKFLVELEERLLFDGAITATAGTNTLGAIFETLPGAQHALYRLSAYSATAGVVVVTDGASPGFAALHVGISRARLASPVRVTAQVNVVNVTGSDQDVLVRVWRRLGMGS